MTSPRLENVADVYVLSPMQQGMLFHTISEPGSGVFVNQISSLIDADLDVDIFKDAWARLVARHSVLRTAFVWDGLDEPHQVVRERAELDWSLHDWSNLDVANQTTRLRDLLSKDRRISFDLNVAPLARMTLLRLGPSSWRWIWTFHHLIVDGWSVQVLLDELRAIYTGERRDEPADLGAPVPYGDFIAWRADQDESGAQSFWQARLEGFSTPLRLEVPGVGADSPIPGHRTHTLTLDSETTAALRQVAASRRVTLNAAVLGAWALVLARWTRVRDIVFGVTTSGRPADLAGVERVVGLFINTVPLRIDVKQDAEVGTWLRTMQQELIALQDHQHAPLASIHRWSDVDAGESLFESIFVFENYPPAAADQPDDIRIGNMEFIEQSNYPLAVLVVPGEELSIMLVHDGTRFSDEAVGRIGNQLKKALRQFAINPDQILSDVVLTTHTDLDLLREWGNGGEAEQDDRCVHQIIEDVSQAEPDATAVVFEDRSMTYGDLDNAANAVAMRLQKAGVGTNQPVGLYLPRSMEMVVGMLAILKAGGAYVPLDPSYPIDHIRDLLENDGVAVVLTDGERQSEVPTTTSVVRIDEPATSPVVDPPTSPVSADDLAYVIHTSGSTGTPKGVMVTHRSLVSSTNARTHHYGQPVGKFLLLSSFAFDSSVVGIFWTLCTGGTLVVPSPGLEQDIDRLLALAAEQQVTHLLCLPALYELMLDNSRRNELGSLTVAIAAGEPCPPSVATAHFEGVPAAELHNEYGPTEATVWCAVHRISSPVDRGPIPIGRPIAGTKLYVLDENGSRTPIGFSGELCVAGAGVARGYLRQPDLTDERFRTIEIDGSKQRVYQTGDLVCYRSDGELLFLGRADAQVKVRGHRIEVEAVEAALRAHPAVRDAVVAARPASGRTGLRLIAYAELANAALTDGSAIRGDLRTTLPEFMVPDTIVVIENLPRRPNGKVDHGALPDPRALVDATHSAFAQPRTNVEATLAAIWSELLSVERVGIHDDYFALGGDSIISIQLISRARQAGIHLEPAQVASRPTIAELAAAAGKYEIDAGVQGPVTGEVPLGPIQRWFFEAELAVPEHWNHSRLFEVDTNIDVEALSAALGACVTHHDMLRAGYEQENGRWRQFIDPVTDDILDVADLEEPSIISDLAAVAESSLDLARARPFRALLIRRQGSSPVLLLAIHHLVVDVVSWTILLDDLTTAYRQSRNGESVVLPTKTTSFGTWVNRLEKHDRFSELAFWLNQQEGPPFPVDHVGTGFGVEASAHTAHAALDAAETRALLTEANEAYRTRPHELLVAALASTLTAWWGGRLAQVELEGHGRLSENDLDVSRTVGWFTAAYPLTLTLTDPGDDAGIIKEVKERMRTVPNDGVGYGVLRYLQEEPSLSGQPAPPVLFNYIGRDIASMNEMFRPMSAEDESSRAPDNDRLHLLEVIATVNQGRLTTDWHYSADIHERSTIETLANNYIKALRRLLEHCGTEGAGGFTPSDFPESGLDQDELDHFLEDIG